MEYWKEEGPREWSIGAMGYWLLKHVDFSNPFLSSEFPITPTLHYSSFFIIPLLRFLYSQHLTRERNNRRG